MPEIDVIALLNSIDARIEVLMDAGVQVPALLSVSLLEVQNEIRKYRKEETK